MTKPSKDWTEDFIHENGKYMNKCVHCSETFLGHKRRIICKECNLIGNNLKPKS